MMHHEKVETLFAAVISAVASIAVVLLKGTMDRQAQTGKRELIVRDQEILNGLDKETVAYEQLRQNINNRVQRQVEKDNTLKEDDPFYRMVLGVGALGLLLMAGVWIIDQPWSENAVSITALVVILLALISMVALVGGTLWSVAQKKWKKCKEHRADMDRPKTTPTNIAGTGATDS